MIKRKAPIIRGKVFCYFLIIAGIAFALLNLSRETEMSIGLVIAFLVFMFAPS